MERPNRSKIGRQFHYVFFVTAEVSAALTLFGSLLSIFLNFIRFRIIGIDFFVVATPSDLLMSGFGIFLIYGPVIAISGLAITSGKILKKFRYSETIFSSKFIIIPSIIMVIIFFVWLQFRGGLLWSIEEFENRNFDAWEYFCIFFSAYSISIVSITIFFGNVWTKAVNLVLTLPFLMGFIGIYFEHVSTQATELYVEGQCKGLARVVWAGSENLVISCDLDYMVFSDREEYFVVQRAGNILRTHRFDLNDRFDVQGDLE